MITKKFEQFINELKYQTYAKAAKGLEEKGHKERAEKLRKHNFLHRQKMEMIKNYPDLRPFEMWVQVSEQSEQPDNTYKEEKITVYLSTFSYIPSEDNECGSVDIQPIFLYNRKEPYMDPNNFNLFKTEKEHRKSVDECLTTDYSLNMSYYGDGEFDFYSFEGEKDYYKFTNRRDAVRFKKIINSDPHFIDCLVDATKGCDDLDPFLIHKKFVDSIRINDLFVY